MLFLAIAFLCLYSASLTQGHSHPNVTFLYEKAVLDPSITKVHIIFMNHLDVGYSDNGGTGSGFAVNVLNTYFHKHFPNAIKLAQDLRSQGYVETFKYTTHPWLLDIFFNCVNMSLAYGSLQCPNSTVRNSMIQAIKNGDIIWHDGPMNMNYENLNAFGLTVALNVSARLNKMFGIQKSLRVVSLRDVPGLSRGVIRTFLGNNVFGVTHGINSGSAAPKLPSLCRWKAAQRYPNEKNVPEIIYMQNPLGYPDPPGPNPNMPGGMSEQQCHRALGTTEILCFFFRSDNLGPPATVVEVLSAYEIVRARYPNAQLFASSLETFFQLLWQNRNQLPQVDNEMGDTWIQGTASDPKKFARFRAMQRLFEQFYEIGFPFTDEVVNASRFLIKPAEHTYGLSGVNDQINWQNDKFAKARNAQTFIDSEMSWIEQRQFEQAVLDLLGPNNPLNKAILQAFKDMESRDGYNGMNLKQIATRTQPSKSSKSYNFTCTNNTHSIEVGFQDGAISYLLADKLVITAQNLFGKLVYRTYNETDTDFFLKYYRTYWNTGYGKPNSTDNAHPESKEWNIVMKAIYKKEDSPCAFLCVVGPEDDRASTYYGLPNKISVLWDINITKNEISTEVYWENKPPTRLMEALFFKFEPAVVGPYEWVYSKMGEPISPQSVVLNGSQWQHNVDDNGVFLKSTIESKQILQIIPWDTGITCPITKMYGPTVWPAPLFPITDAITGVAFNFYNNVWNTNYIYWYPYRGEDTERDDMFKGRFTTRINLLTK